MTNHLEAALRALEHQLNNTEHLVLSVICHLHGTATEFGAVNHELRQYFGRLRDELAAILRQIEAAPSPPGSPADSSQGEPVACPFAMPVYVEDIRDCGDGRGRYTAFKIVDSEGRSICDTINADMQCIHEEIDADDDYSSVNRWDENGRKNLWFIARAINTYTTPPPSSPQVADGYAIVPVEATAEMLAHALDQLYSPACSADDMELARAAAMICLQSGKFALALGSSTLDSLAAGIGSLPRFWRELVAAAPAAPQSAPDDEPLFTVSMYGTAAAADKTREEWLAAKVEAKRRVFIDMDGVVVDFDKRKGQLGLTGDQIKTLEGAYLDMEPMPGAIAAVRSVIGMGFDVWLATKPPTGIPHAYSDKAAWVFQHLPELKRKLVITHDKGMLGCDRDILIDDRPHKANCEQFRGTLIRFTDGKTWADVISQLRSLAQADKDKTP